MQSLPRAGRLARAELNEYAPLIERTFEQYLDAAATLLAAVQTRGDDARVGDDEQVARPEKPDEIGKATILDRARGPVEHEQSRRAALRQRRLRDQLLGKVVGEIRALHCLGTGSRRSACASFIGGRIYRRVRM